MKSFFAQRALDTTGFLVSALCALHCVAIPILLSFTAFSSWTVLKDSSIERVVLGLSVTLGTISLLPSYFRHHRKLTAIAALLTGFVLIGLSRFADPGIIEGVLTIVGALTVASAHGINFRLCRKYHRKE